MPSTRASRESSPEAPPVPSTPLWAARCREIFRAPRRGVSTPTRQDAVKSWPSAATRWPQPSAPPPEVLGRLHPDHIPAAYGFASAEEPSFSERALHSQRRMGVNRDGGAPHEARSYRRQSALASSELTLRSTPQWVLISSPRRVRVPSSPKSVTFPSPSASHTASGSLRLHRPSFTALGSRRCASCAEFPTAGFPGAHRRKRLECTFTTSTR